MKKLLLIIGLIFIGLINYAQMPIQKSTSIDKYVPNPTQVSLKNITVNQVYNGWGINGRMCSGCPSYYYKILMTTDPIRAEDGHYYFYYYFYFFSNSHYSDGTQASTYLKNINFYASGVYMFNIDYLLIPPNDPIWGAWIRTKALTTVEFHVANIMVH